MHSSFLDKGDAKALHYHGFAMNVQIFDRLKSDYPGLLPKLLNMLNVVMGVLLVIFIFVFARDIFSLINTKKEKVAVSVPPQVRTSQKSFQEYAPIVRNNPFGPAGDLKLLSFSTDKSAPKPDMAGLTLVGTVSGSPRYSYAVFLDKSNNQEIFRTGDAVHDYGVLQKVEKDRVFIKNNGTLVEVPVADFLAVVDANPAQNNNRPSAFAKNINEGAYIVDQRKVQQAVEKPNQIMTDARLLPNIADGKQQGFILSEVKQGGIYQSLGLQNGDVLLRINEFNISNPENALQAFMTLKGMDRVQLDIVRGGARMTMNYQIR